MNYSTAVFLLNDNARAMRCVYDPSEAVAKEYTFKTIDPTIKKDDLVVVPTSTRHGFTVVKVIEEDVDVNTDAPYEMKWIISKVDLAEYQALLDKEKEVVSAVRRADIKRKRKDLAETLFKDNLEEMKALGLATVGTMPAPETPKA